MLTDKDHVVAVKTYHAKKAFYDEVERLNYLKAAFRGSRNGHVMKHKSAIVHGNTFMTIFPIAELRDLDLFLREGYSGGPNTSNGIKVYDFDKEFEQLRIERVLHNALIRECFELSSALFWLH